MARARKWKETLVLACVTLLMSVTQGWSRETRDAATHGNLEYSRLITGVAGKTAFGVELMARRPFVRLIRTSRVPLPIALAPGALMAMAAPLGANRGTDSAGNIELDGGRLGGQFPSRERHACRPGRAPMAVHSVSR